MEDTRREELRRLALWLSRRRATDEVVEQLTAYGPAASERVLEHAEALAGLLDAEREAFEALRPAAAGRPQSPLPQVAPPRTEDDGGTVHSLQAAKARRTP